MPAAYELSVFFYPMNRIIFQPDGTRTYQYSIVPLCAIRRMSEANYRLGFNA
jgi:hypothetical protein